MTMPLLAYKPTAQNHRVQGFGTSDRHLKATHCLNGVSATALDNLIWTAYRQVFNEQETLAFNRQITLETRLKNGSITVRDFIRGLAKSERFYRLVVEPNNNYRLVEVCLKRLLGREPYNQEEKIAWSVQIGTLGFHGFVDALIDSEEYNQNFGDATVPYQRQRMEQRPFSFTPRYGADYRDKLPSSLSSSSPFEPFRWQEFMQQTNWPTVAGVLLSLVGVVGFLLLIGLSTGSLAG